MNILVTGGAGFIGKNFLLKRLNKSDNNDVFVNLDILTYAGNANNITNLSDKSNYYFIKGGIEDRNLIRSLLRDYSIDKVVHFAAESHVDRSIDSPETFFQTNVIGTLRLIDEVRIYLKEKSAKHANSFRFIHVSTDEIYGSLEYNKKPFKESKSYGPNNPYAASKAASNHIIRAYYKTYEIPVIITNCSNNFGPYQFPEKLIPMMIMNAKKGKSLPIYGDGQQLRDWVYVDDHCDALWLILIKGHIGQSYNIGGNEVKSNMEVVDLICELMDEYCPKLDGGTYRYLKQHVRDRPGHDRGYAVDISKIQKELGWKPKQDFESGLRKTVRWYLDNPQWSKNVDNDKCSLLRLGLRNFE